MKAADEPACLTVGTDVSAKYRGAFCEAKIKTVKRLVKVKVTLKGESTSQVIQDDQVKGPLRVGSTVEVRTNEGVCSEATISKLTDASMYTVVFDDGDEKTLRRTSLCLKGERHFAVSETLDQLPLTNPEHFGTPVIGKKSNRGGRRSSQAVADEENDLSSSDEEEEEKKRLTDELLGQVCSIENLDESVNWFMALMVSPSCNEELVLKKDQCLVRSFYDGKFYTVARRHAHLINTVSINKLEFFNRKGFKEAQMFLKSREVPDVWKMDMCQILDTSSSEEDKDDKESEEEEGDNNNDGNEQLEEEEDEDEHTAGKDEEEDEMRRNRSEDEEDGDSVTGTKVRVKYGRGKTQKIYEAHIKKADNDNGEQFYLVHYYGWNVRYDEWVKADRIIWPAEKGTRRTQRKKVKNKDVPEREREKDEEKLTPLGGVKPTGLKRGRPQIRTPPTSSAGRGILRTGGGEGQSNGRFTRMDSSNLANGDDTPRRRTRRTSSMYESDQASNEDSGNSSVDSETDDQPEKNDHLLPWQKSSQPEEEQEDAEEEMEVKEEMEESSVVEHADSSPVAMVTSAPLSAVAVPGCPSTLQEKADEELSQSERREEAQGADPFGESSMMSPDLDRDSRTCPVPSTASVQCQNKMSPGQEVLHETALHMIILQGEAATSPRATEDSSHSSPQASPRVKGLLRMLREAADSTAAWGHLLPKSSSAANSDTDSATEEEVVGEGGGPEPSPQERLKQKSEQSPADKKERIPEDVSPKNTSTAKALVSPPHPERRSDVGVRANNLPHPVEAPQSNQAEEHPDEEPEVHAGSPPPVPEFPAPVPVEELEPQIGPEALVCHEVDLDDPDDKEKPSSSSDHLLMLREQQEALPPLPLVVHSCLTPHSSPHPPQPQVRPFLLAPKPNTCPKEHHSVNEATEEEQGAARGELEGDFSPGFEGSASSSTTSLLSLQENKDRGQKRVSDCSSSPSAKKHKRSQKRPHAAAKVDKNGAGHSSDSEDQSRLLSLSKPHKSRCPGLSPPSAHSKDKQSPPPHQRSYKWTLQLDELDSMSSAERISFLQEKLQEMKKYYMSLKSEVASIDRRRKRLKKKEREVSNTTASTSSGSSDTGMSPSSASPTQNTVAVECR
uniref:AT rich interactive domain 4A (RBP1-like) n=2 Tax=Nothobranchius kadleci TaxID=1051664 RepID=A0A1A8BL12_NOTKA